MSSKFEIVKRYYDFGMWTKSQVHAAVYRAWITPEEYKLITGEEYQGGEI
ncbi:MAG: XkdX family protein [Synergistaceae bacterium]|nr:XkdX family protein [Synergistaceae bacterium]